MEPDVSSPKTGGASHSDCISDPEEKEISDDEDDDRNHKHRRRDTRSQSLERDSLEQVLNRPYRKRNKPFENRHAFRENDSQPSESWRNNSINPVEKDFSGKFEKRRPGLMTYPRAPLDLNQRIRINQSSSAELGPGRVKGRESGSWDNLDSRFCSVDITSQMVQPGSVPPSLFAGRGLPNVSNGQTASWSAFGLVPGMPNGGLDALHSLGLQGTLRPPISATLNMGIPRQRCRDFEERGFCLRGDMCPMEHGVNRIVVEDVQSLSQFNLPVSLPSAHLLGTPGGPGPLSSVSAPSSSLMNSKGLHSKSSKPGLADNGSGLNGAFTGYVGAGGADFYDPDQPLWTNDCPESSTALLGLNSSHFDETESLVDGNPSDSHLARLFDGSENEHAGRSIATTVAPQSASLSVWGRIGSLKNRSEIKDKIDSTIRTSTSVENEAREYEEPLTSLQGVANQGKRTHMKGVGPQAIDLSLKSRGDIVQNIRKPSRKALRTLFVNGIPQKNNKREALLSHFQKFGEVIDIYIPLNSERAFVQFSKREEAEAALKSPDAVMGNRFIKLWWANRDSIPDEGISSNNNVPMTPHSVKVASVPTCPSAANGEKDNHQSTGPEVGVAHPSIPNSGHLEPMITNSPKAPPPLQKKLENIELLKEELRKKQEMLDLKRKDFQRQLDKLEKQSTGLKGEVASEQAIKRSKVGTASDVSKAANLSTNHGTTVALPLGEVKADNNKSSENVVHHSSKSSMMQQEPSSLKRSIRPLAPVGAPFVMNRFKLDNRPTAFKIIPPLPTGFANVAVLKEHFSMYGDLSTVELEDFESNDSEGPRNCSAHISFTTRRSAERAFVNGNCWQGHNLQFMWLTPSKFSNDNGSRENTPSASKGPSDANMQPAGEAASIVFQEAVDPPSASSWSSGAHTQPVGEIASILSLEAAASGDGSSKNLEGRESGAKHTEREEDFRSCLSSVLCEKQSPGGDAC